MNRISLALLGVAACSGSASSAATPPPTNVRASSITAINAVTGDITRCVVPSRQSVLSFRTTWPAAFVCTRSLARAGRVM